MFGVNPPINKELLYAGQYYWLAIPVRHREIIIIVYFETENREKGTSQLSH